MFHQRNSCRHQRHSVFIKAVCFFCTQFNIFTLANSFSFQGSSDLCIVEIVLPYPILNKSIPMKNTEHGKVLEHCYCFSIGVIHHSGCFISWVYDAFAFALDHPAVESCVSRIFSERPVHSVNFKMTIPKNPGKMNRSKTDGASTGYQNLSRIVFRNPCLCMRAADCVPKNHGIAFEFFEGLWMRNRTHKVDHSLIQRDQISFMCPWIDIGMKPFSPSWFQAPVYQKLQGSRHGYQRLVWIDIPPGGFQGRTVGHNLHGLICHGTILYPWIALR